MNSAKVDVENFIKETNKAKDIAFMARIGKNEELRYVIHNKDHFISVINDLDKILNNLSPNASLLDIGTSPITFILKKRYPKLNLTSIDITNNLATRAKNAGIEFKLIDLNLINKLPKNKKYDVIIFLEVLEHLKPQNHKGVIRWVSNILKDGGICLLQTPNKYSLKSLVLKIIGEGVWNKVSEMPDVPKEFTHLKEYSLSELAGLVNMFKQLRVLQASHRMYFDTLDSTIVYRKSSPIITLMLKVSFIITLLIPPSRRGMQVILTKKSDSTSVYQPRTSAYRRWDDRTYPYHYESVFTLLELSIVKSGVQEIIKIAKTYFDQPINKLRVLDIGSGRGEYTRELSKKFGEVVGIEPYRDVYNFCLQYTSKKYKKISFINKSIEDFQSRQKFDLIIMLTVFEHMSNPKKSFDNIFGLLKKGGIIYLTAPNKYWIYEQHYGLPFLSWLPLPIANEYLKLIRGIQSYKDSSYSRSFNGMKKFFNQYKCKYEFLLPVGPENPFIGCGKTEFSYHLIRKYGIKLIRLHPFFWNFSKGFIMVVKKNN